MKASHPAQDSLVQQLSWLTSALCPCPSNLCLVCMRACPFTQLCPALGDPKDHSPARLLCPWGFSRQEPWMCSHVLLQGVFPTRGSNLSLLCLLALAGGFFTTEPAGKPLDMGAHHFNSFSLYLIDCKAGARPELTELGGYNSKFWVLAPMLRDFSD